MTRIAIKNGFVVRCGVLSMTTVGIGLICGFFGASGHHSAGVIKDCTAGRGNIPEPADRPGCR